MAERVLQHKVRNIEGPGTKAPEHGLLHPQFLALKKKGLVTPGKDGIRPYSPGAPAGLQGDGAEVWGDFDTAGMTGGHSAWAGGSHRWRVTEKDHQGSGAVLVCLGRSDNTAD